jgi:ribosomal protein S3
LYSAHDTKKAIRGIKISIKGKINATDRTRVKIIQEGIIPIQSFNKHVTYGIAHARVKTGAFGIKV